MGVGKEWAVRVGSGDGGGSGRGGGWSLGVGGGGEGGGWGEGRVMTTKTNYGKKELKGIRDEDSS